MNGEYTFNTNTVRHATNCESFSDATVVLSDNSTFENLNTFFFAFLNSYVYLNGATDKNIPDKSGNGYDLLYNQTWLTEAEMEEIRKARAARKAA